jgi:hypothetical protein
MSGTDNSLLGFLQKKSLFSNSPSKSSRKRSRSKSRDSRNLDKRSNINSFEEPPRAEEPRRQLFQEERNGNEPRLFATFQENRPSDYPPYRPFEQPQQQSLQPRATESPPRLAPRVEERSEGGLWTGMMMSASSFESARLESSQCLENLSGKIRAEVSSVTYRIDAFNSKMSKVLSNEFKAVRERILRVFEDAFKESEKYIKEYMAKKEQQMTAELAQMKVQLEKEAARVEEMKEELNKPQWRKVAGEILSTEFEKRVEELVKKSQGIEAGHW